MGYIVKNPEQHSCTRPTGGTPGDVWRCDECGQGWKAIGSVVDSRRVGYWAKLFGWRLRQFERRAAKQRGIK